MADMKQIYEFAVKWYDKFRDKNINYIELVDHYMADDSPIFRCLARLFIPNGGISITGRIPARKSWSRRTVRGLR